MMKDIKAIIFDWGGVCCKEGEPFASHALQQKLSLDPSQIAQEVKDIYAGYYVGRYDRDTFWRAIMRHFSLQENAEINPTALSDAYLNSYVVYQDVLDLISNLHKNYTIGLLSNLTPEMKAKIVAVHGLAHYFDAMVFSCDPDVVSMKPDLRPYEVMLQKINMEAEQCLFIDNTQKNLDAASTLGMKVLLFSDKDTFLTSIMAQFAF